MSKRRDDAQQIAFEGPHGDAPEKVREKNPREGAEAAQYNPKSQDGHAEAHGYERKVDALKRTKGRQHKVVGNSKNQVSYVVERRCVLEDSVPVLRVCIHVSSLLPIATLNLVTSAAYPANTATVNIAE